MSKAETVNELIDLAVELGVATKTTCRRCQGEVVLMEGEPAQHLAKDGLRTRKCYVASHDPLTGTWDDAIPRHWVVDPVRP